MTPRSTKYFRYYTYIAPVVKNPIIKTYGYAIFTIISTIVFILFAIKPTLETIVVLQKKLENQQNTIQKIDKKIKDLEVAQKNYQNIDPNIKSKITTSVPYSVEVGNLIRSLENTTINTTASISALQFQPLSIERTATPSNKLQEISFTFNVEGSYNSLKGILQNLYNVTRIITIDKLTFNKIESSKILLMSISGKANYLK